MKIYVPVTFAFLGLAFYVGSGGSGFAPEVQPDAAMTTPAEIVSRADTEPTLAVLTDLPVIEPVADIDAAAVADSVALALAAPVEPLARDPVVATALVSDLRAVDAELVNLRDGPGTEYGVIDKLSRGTEVEVIEAGADGWVKLRVPASGAEGWMAARLLTDART